MTAFLFSLKLCCCIFKEKLYVIESRPQQIFLLVKIAAIKICVFSLVGKVKYVLLVK